MKSGGGQYVFNGGTTSATTVSSGGSELVSNGGTASGTTVLSGGLEYFYSGGTAANTTLSGGTLVIASGGAAAGTVTFCGSGTLELDRSTSWGTPNISGLVDTSQKIDLADVNLATATLGYSGNTLSGTLTVGDGTHTATLALLGQHFQTDFALTNDGNGGTIVTDPPPLDGLAGLAGQPFLTHSSAG